MNFKKYLALGTALTLTLLAGCGSSGSGDDQIVEKICNVIRTIFGSDPNRAVLRLDYALTEELSSFD